MMTQPPPISPWIPYLLLPLLTFVAAFIATAVSRKVLPSVPIGFAVAIIFSKGDSLALAGWVAAYGLVGLAGGLLGLRYAAGLRRTWATESAARLVRPFNATGFLNLLRDGLPVIGFYAAALLGLAGVKYLIFHIWRVRLSVFPGADILAQLINNLGSIYTATRPGFPIGPPLQGEPAFSVGRLWFFTLVANPLELVLMAWIMAAAVGSLWEVANGRRLTPAAVVAAGRNQLARLLGYSLLYGLLYAVPLLVIGLGEFLLFTRAHDFALAQHVSRVLSYIQSFALIPVLRAWLLPGVFLGVLRLPRRSFFRHHAVPLVVGQLLVRAIDLLNYAFLVTMPLFMILVISLTLHEARPATVEDTRTSSRGPLEVAPGA